MEKKKVAVLLPWLKMGRTNKIALNFMEELSSYCDVPLILSEHTGELLDEVPEKITLVIDEMKPFKKMFYSDLKKFRIFSIIRDFIYYGKIKMGKDNIDNYKYIVDRHDYICDTKFDCAISYHGQSPERLLNLLYRVHSKRKVAWIHGEMTFSKDKCQRLQKFYDKIDHFFFVSGPTKNSFEKVISVGEGKTTIYHNPINKEDILKKSKEKFSPPFSDDCINILTVGRVSAEKGQDMIPKITRKLIDSGYNIRWYIIGDGDMCPEIEQLIREEQVKEYVRLLGVKTNPYCYMKECDIYVQPSYTEGYSTTICEAGMLGKAIVGTKPSGGIRDQITDGEDGLIVDASVEGIAEGISKLLLDEKLLHNFERKILNKNFEGKNEIKKFLAFLQDS